MKKAMQSNLNDLKFIEKFVSKGGPDHSEYKTWNTFIEMIYWKFKNGYYTKSDISKINRHFGKEFVDNTIQGFGLKKPFGYAGDFKIIDMIYTEHKSEHPKYRNWDIFFHQHAAPNAVRNRKEYFKKIMLERINKHEDVLTLLDVASGPARDLQELYQQISPFKLKTTCIELDKEAISYARQLTCNYAEHIQFVSQDIFNYEPSQKFDVIWAAGLFDYFDDKAFVAILSRFMKWLKPEGEIIIGNFSTNNPSRVYMELFGEWYLHHRDENHLKSLAIKAGAKTSQIFVGHEPEKVNLFLHLSAQT